MRGYVVHPKDLFFAIDGHTSDSSGARPAYLWETNPGSPAIGFAAINGTIYLSDATRPALLVGTDGKARIRSAYTLAEVENSRLVIGGGPVLVNEGGLTSDVNVPADTERPRVVIGVLSGGDVVHFYLPKATLRGAALVARSLGCIEAMQLVVGEPKAQARAALGGLVVWPLPEKTVVIDDGHGGADPGTSGHGMKEKDYNYIEGSLVRGLLHEFDVLVLPTRLGDEAMSLKDRSTLANAAGADFFLSIHHNGHNGTSRGYEDFIYLTAGEWSQRAQSIIQNHIKPLLVTYKIPNRGAKKADFHVVRETRMPAVLVEWLFMDNPEDARLIKDTAARQAYCQALAKAVVEILALQPKAKAPTTPPPRLYRVQVGAFSDIQNAQALVNKLKSAGFEGVIVG